MRLPFTQRNVGGGRPLRPWKVKIMSGQRLMAPRRWRRRLMAPASLAAALVVGAAAQAQQQDEAPFLAENEAAMSTMMQGMAVAPTGDVDHDFAAMMIPHHQGAIDMAMAELQYGKNEQLRRLAQEIIVTQQQEIAADAAGDRRKLPASAPAPTQVTGRHAVVRQPRHAGRTMSHMHMTQEPIR